MNNNESPLSIKEQIEVLEAAKGELSDLSNGFKGRGLCLAIKKVIKKKHNHLYSLVGCLGASAVIPSFTFENAVLSVTVDNDAVPYWFWWDTSVEKGGITNRLKFLDYLINELKK